MDRFVIVETTTDDRDVAELIAHAAIERRLGACARISPVTSVYRWDGAVTTAEEFAVAIKSTADRRAALETLILELHTYALPEVIVTPIIGGSQAYLDWVSAEVTD